MSAQFTAHVLFDYYLPHKCSNLLHVVTSNLLTLVGGVQVVSTFSNWVIFEDNLPHDLLHDLPHDCSIMNIYYTNALMNYMINTCGGMQVVSTFSNWVIFVDIAIEERREALRAAVLEARP